MGYSKIRAFIREAVAERRLKSEISSPSDYWQEFTELSHYVHELSDDELARIRHHAFHLTGDIYLRYYFATDVYRRDLFEEFEWLCARLHGFRYGEGPQGIGFASPDGKVSVDVVRYLSVICDLDAASVIRRRGAQSILEIGGGYGGLCAITMRYNPETTYTIVDLEETLYFSAVHLTNVLGPDRVVLVASPVAKPISGVVYLVPQSRKSMIEALDHDVVINQQSMQEMTKSQVEAYCDLIEMTSRFFYTCNMEQHSPSIVARTGIVQGLNAYLSERFTETLWEQSPRSRFLDRVATAGAIVPTLTKAYRYWLKEPARRVSEVNLRRTVFRVGAEKARYLRT